MMTMTDHERAEWQRCGKAHLAAGKKAAAQRLAYFSTRASLSRADYDHAATIYRAWLVFNELAD